MYLGREILRGPFQSRDNYASAADVKFVIVMHR